MQTSSVSEGEWLDMNGVGELYPLKSEPHPQKHSTCQAFGSKFSIFRSLQLYDI